MTTQGERDWFSRGLLHHSFPAGIGKNSVCRECTRFWLLQHFGCSDVKQIAEPTAWSPLDVQDSLLTPRYPINTSSMCTWCQKVGKDFSVPGLIHNTQCNCVVTFFVVIFISIPNVLNIVITLSVSLAWKVFNNIFNGNEVYLWIKISFELILKN